jgi:hypothetical protein
MCFYLAFSVEIPLDKECQAVFVFRATLKITLDQGNKGELRL